MTYTPRTNQMDRAIGEAVRKRREARRLNIIDAANAIGLSVAEYEACELGYQPFQAKHLFSLSEVFDCNARDLMPNNDRLAGMHHDVRFGEPEEVRDLIFYFSGVVSPALRRHFIKQMEEASVQGERLADPVPLPTHAAAAKPVRKKKRQKAFRFLRAN